MADSKGVEALVKVIIAFPENAAVQLSVLLCLIPLALDNPLLQSQIADLALCHVVTALRIHIDHSDIQAKGLVVLGVLGQVKPYFLQSRRINTQNQCMQNSLPRHSSYYCWGTEGA